LSSDQPLTVGNTAKLYCLRLIDEAASRCTGEFRILDLGCGDGRNFVRLLQRRSNIRYIGVDQAQAAVERARAALPSAQILHARAEDVRVDPVDAVVSFSALTYAVDRRGYVEAARSNLHGDGAVYLNYDAGRASMAGLADQAKERGSRAFARLGLDWRYRAFIRDHDFDALVTAAGFMVDDDKRFNCGLKQLYPLLSGEARDRFMDEWLAFELSLNELDVVGAETSSILRTRNVVLTL